LTKITPSFFTATCRNPQQVELLTSLSPRQVCDFKPFYPAAKVIVIGAISLSKVLAVMTLNNSAVVVMDNLPAHEVAPIVPMIKAMGAHIIYLYAYFPNFNPIELWWFPLKSFWSTFASTTSEMIDRIIAVALQLINSVHLKNWFTKLLLLYFLQRKPL
jgi:putative transposase